MRHPVKHTKENVERLRKNFEADRRAALRIAKAQDEDKREACNAVFCEQRLNPRSPDTNGGNKGSSRWRGA